MNLYNYNMFNIHNNHTSIFVDEQIQNYTSVSLYFYNTMPLDSGRHGPMGFL